MKTEIKASIGWDRTARDSIVASMSTAMATGQVSLGAATQFVEAHWPQEGGDRHTVTTSSGTSALELVWRILQPKVIIVPEMTVPMVHWAAARSGAAVFKVDVDEYMCADMDKVNQIAVDCTSTGKTAMSDLAICYVATGGVVAPNFTQEAIRWNSMGIQVVVDMSHAHGVTSGGHGPYLLADAAIWSFYATKVLTCGEGGAAWFRSRKHWETARVLANQGKERGSGKFVHQGYNFRMNEFGAAVLASEVLTSISTYAKRRSTARRYREIGIQCVQHLVPGLDSTFYKYPVPLTATKYGANQADLVEAAFRSHGIECTGRVHGVDDNGGKPWDGPVARYWSKNHICLPISRQFHGEHEADAVARAWREIKA